MKIYAKQVPPEFQQSPLFLGDEFWPEDIALFGNRDYIGHAFDLFDDLPGILDELSDAWDDLHAGRCAWYDSWGAALADLARPQGRPPYTRAERKHAWPALLAAWDGCDKTIMCDALELITGRGWDWRTLRGCCQSDWIYCIFPVDNWDENGLSALEAEYFNTGTEWIVHDENAAPECPEDINGFSMYAHGWSDEQIKTEIAEAYGTPGAEVVLYKIAGQHIAYDWEAV